MLKKSTKIIIGSSALLACLTPMVYGTHKFFGNGGLKIDPDELYFDDKEIEKIKRESCRCHCREEDNTVEAKTMSKESKNDKTKSKETTTSKKNIIPSDEEIVSLLTEVAPNNQKFCDAVVDFVNSASTTLDPAQKKKIFHSTLCMINEIIDAKIENEESCDSHNPHVCFDGENFFDENGKKMSDSEMSDYISNAKSVSVNLSEVNSSFNAEEGVTKLIEHIISSDFEGKEFDPVQLIRSLCETKK